jgi:hypothetical protein
MISPRPNAFAPRSRPHGSSQAFVGWPIQLARSSLKPAHNVARANDFKVLSPPLRAFSLFRHNPSEAPRIEALRAERTVSQNEMSGFATRSQAIEIIGGSETGVSPNCLFSTA